jgi:hypothetical protein
MNNNCISSVASGAWEQTEEKTPCHWRYVTEEFEQSCYFQGATCAACPFFEGKNDDRQRYHFPQISHPLGKGDSRCDNRAWVNEVTIPIGLPPI